MDKQAVLDTVKKYYGKELSSTADLITEGCPSSEMPVSDQICKALEEVHGEVKKRYFGCGLAIPEKLKNMDVLDLGSGSGRDCYILSKLVGQNGSVTGVDMTDELVQFANQYVAYHKDKYGYIKANVKFVEGFIEKLHDAGVEDSSIDVLISNGVVNLCQDKRAVLSEAYRVLKMGGELYFSDVYADRDLPDDVRKNKLLWGECISGALWWKDLYRLAKEIGFCTPRLVTASERIIRRGDLKQLLGDAKFSSVTYRLFKIPQKMEPRKDVVYNGHVTEMEKQLVFDHRNTFKTGEQVTVDAETATIVTYSRFRDEFDLKPVSQQCDDETSINDIRSTEDMDPFKYMEESKLRGESTATVCCDRSGTNGC